MKTKKHIAVIATMLAALSWTAVFALHESSYSASLELEKSHGSKGPATFTVMARLGVVEGLVRITQDERNRFVVQTPPFVCIDVDGILLAGELKATGLLALMLDPFHAGLPYKGFQHGSNIALASPPSTKPKTSGFALCADKIDVLVLDPAFNTSSPKGFGAIVGDEGAFAAFLAATQNGALLRKATPNLQVDWRQLGMGRHMLFSMVGSSFQGKIGPMELEGACFVQNAWDLDLGGGTSLGLGLKAKANGASLKYERKLGGVGVKLKSLYEERNPMDSLVLSCTLGKAFEIEYSYRQRFFAPPKYGGMSQQRDIELASSIRFKGLSLECSNHLDFGTDRGRTPYSVLTLKISGFNAPKVGFELSARLDRSGGTMGGLSQTTLAFSCERAQLSAKGGRVSLKYNYRVDIEGFGALDIAIDQSRTVTLRLSLQSLDDNQKSVTTWK